MPEGIHRLGNVNQTGGLQRSHTTFPPIATRIHSWGHDLDTTSSPFVIGQPSSVESRFILSKWNTCFHFLFIHFLYCQKMQKHVLALYSLFHEYIHMYIYIYTYTDNVYINVYIYNIYIYTYVLPHPTQSPNSITTSCLMRVGLAFRTMSPHA